MLVCNQCKTNNPDTAYFCGSCGSQVQSTHNQTLLKVLLLVSGLCVVTFFALGVVGYFLSTANTPKSTVEVKRELPFDRVQRGQAIYTRIKKFKENERAILIMGFQNPVVSMILDKKKWETLSKEEQIDLTYYVESRVAHFRVLPDTYLDIPANAPAYPSAVAFARQIKDDNWAIIVGRPNAKGVLSIDETVVQGDASWEFAEPCCRGEKASVFRSGN
ncbi:MAG: zinc ribbon domain-containing protein [Pyrinomonadaceae bacterium MAG19_C2-C3]|nr:zinc ribbon domain-containing protein [Pyrinomonadaceae bacterium MAG19_C2-C3]